MGWDGMGWDGSRYFSINGSASLLQVTVVVVSPGTGSNAYCTASRNEGWEEMKDSMSFRLLICKSKNTG